MPPDLTQAKSHSNTEARSSQPSLDGTNGGAPEADIPDPKDVVEEPNPGLEVKKVEPAKTNVPEISEVPVGTGDEKVEVGEVESPAPECGEVPKDTKDAKLPDRPMVSREDQRNLKDAKDMGKTRTRKNKGEGKGEKQSKGNLKRPAAKVKAKATAKGKAKGKGKRAKKQQGESAEEESRDDDVTQATQFYDPSPIRPKNLAKTFEEVDDDKPKKRPSTRTSKAKDPESAGSAGGSKEPPKKRQKRENKANTEVKEQESKTQGKGSKRKTSEEHVEMPKTGSGQSRVSFAGRVAPKSEKARQRFNVMVATYNTKIRQFVDSNNSHFEAGFPKLVFSSNKHVFTIDLRHYPDKPVPLNHLACPDPLKLAWWNWAFKSLLEISDGSDADYQKVAAEKVISFMHQAHLRTFDF